MPSECGGFERKHVGFLPYLEFAEIRHGRNLSASRRRSVIIPLPIEVLQPSQFRLGRGMSVSVKPPALSRLQHERELALKL